MHSLFCPCDTSGTMFTGLVEDIGRVERCQSHSGAVVFSIASEVVADKELGLGDSVAINGVCLTVTERRVGHFTVLAGAETLRLTTLGSLRPGAVVNLERALKVGGRLGGHLMQGHVDGVATMASRRQDGANQVFAFRTPPELSRYIVVKGSIAVDGISLTVNTLDDGSFSVALIPHTVSKTTLASHRVGQKVNLEVDMIGKYVESLLKGYKAS